MSTVGTIIYKCILNVTYCPLQQSSKVLNTVLMKLTKQGTGNNPYNYEMQKEKLSLSVQY